MDALPAQVQSMHLQYYPSWQHPPFNGSTASTSIQSMHLRYCPSWQHPPFKWKPCQHKYRACTCATAPPGKIPLLNGSPASRSTEHAPALLLLLATSPFLMDALPAQVQSMHLQYYPTWQHPPFNGSTASTSIQSMHLRYCLLTTSPFFMEALLAKRNPLDKS
jgi:hypothetical protein